MPSDPEILAEAKKQLPQVVSGLGVLITDSGTPLAMQKTHIDLMKGIHDDVKTFPVNNAADVRALLKLAKTSRTLVQRAQALINAAVEGKGGPDVPGPEIKPGDISGRLVGTVNIIIRLNKFVNG